MAELETLRALNYQFRQYLNDHGGWPQDPPTVDWLLERNLPKDRNQLTALRAGHYVPVKYTKHFIRMLFEPPKDPRLRRSHEVFGLFARTRGFSTIDAGSVSLDQLISHACTPTTAEVPSVRTKKRTPFADVFHLGLKMFPDLPMEYVVNSVTRGVSEDFTAEDATRWIFEGFTHSRRPDGFEIGSREAIRFAEETMGIPFEDYARRVADWSRTSPWSVLFACRANRIIGVSILLPVTERSYADVRAGLRATSCMEIDDLQVPSNWIIFEALQENIEFERHNDTDLLEHMRMSVAAQHAAVMQYHPRNEYTRYHFLAIGASQTNTDRLSAAGFKAIPFKNAVNGAPLWEKIVDLVEGENVAPLEEVVLRYLAPLTRGVPRPAKRYRGRT